MTVYCQASGSGVHWEDEWQGIRRVHIPVRGDGPASTMKFDFTAGDSTKFFVGEDAASVYQKVELQATTNHDDRLFVSTVQLELDDAELARRRAAWKAPALKATRGTLYKYIKNVKSASEGCVTDE